MATYFQVNPDIQASDGLQTLVLMNPGYVQFSDSLPPPPTNLLFLNSLAGNSMASQNLHHAPPSQSPHFSSMPLPVSVPPTSQDPISHQTHPHHISALHGFIPGAKFNHWNPINSSADARESQRATQGLSLSLSSQQPGFGLLRAERDASSPSHLASEEIRVSGRSSSISGNTNGGGVSGLHGVLLCSKYLKATQELLDEVVNVSTDGIKNEPTKKPTGAMIGDESSRTATGNASVRIDPAGKDSSELTTAERQEIQMKKVKLMSMLDEVDQRYRQYHHQMQIVVSSFEQSTGIGSARTYTSLALETISRQFRCLKDTISGQIKAANRSLGEEDREGFKIGSSRLKFVDHQLRQQRALQQLGMIQQNAWRPQRGLPERSVSVLRAWLFEHFLHPYPKDSDKQMLAKQTGLTRSQVSNWFINARVRLWKPMVEEMYKEETRDQEEHGSADNMSMINENSPLNSISPTENAPPIKILEGHLTKTASKSAIRGNIQNSPGSRLPGSSKLEDFANGSSPKKQKHSEMAMHSSLNVISSMNIDGKQAQTNPTNMSSKVSNEKHSRDEYSLMMNQANFAGGFGEYPIGRIDRYDDEQFTPRFSTNGVSLTLGLPHHNFLPNQSIHVGRRIEIGEPNEFSGMNSSTPHSTTAFDNIEIQNRKQFVAQLLPDFVV